MKDAYIKIDWKINMEREGYIEVRTHQYFKIYTLFLLLLFNSISFLSCIARQWLQEMVITDKTSVQNS